MFRKSLFKRMQEFNLQDFIKKYDSFSVDEWNNVILQAKKKGFDISQVLEYKAKWGDEFSVINFSDVFDVLLNMNGYMYFSTEEPSHFPTLEEERAAWIKRRDELHIPIPESVRKKLWGN